MSDKQLTQEKRLLKRLVISKNDLSHAQWYANLILSKNLHHSNLDEDKYLHRGLNTALILTYYRPFSMNKDLDGKKNNLSVLTSIFKAEEENLHRLIEDLRNGEVAHSDA
jgi:hypothetical protein